MFIVNNRLHGRRLVRKPLETGFINDSEQSLDQVYPYGECFSMYTIDHAERALRKYNRNGKTLRCYSIAVLQELCDKRGIQVDVGGLRPLKKPYIDALLLTPVR